jgi:hypothetical protein
MNVRKSAGATPAWSLYLTYGRLAVCLLLLPLLVTGMLLNPEARSDFVATVLIITCCVYIDTQTVTRRSRAKARRAR